MSMSLDEFLDAHDWDDLERQHGWKLERDVSDPELIRLRLSARDGEQYVLLCECGGYPEIPPSVTFVNEEGWASDVHAWPTGNAAFVGAVKPPQASFLCIPLTRECLAYHPDFLRNEAVGGWSPEKHTLMDVFVAVQALLNGNDYERRASTALRRNIKLPRRVLETTWEGLRARPTDTRWPAAVWLGHRIPKRQVIDDVCFIDRFLIGAADGSRDRDLRDLFALVRSRQLGIVAEIYCRAGVDLMVTPANVPEPIEYSAGLLAIVVPGGAAEPPNLAAVGVHEYQGQGRWLQLTDAEVSERFTIEAEDGVFVSR
jgi:hypothetical protein